MEALILAALLLAAGCTSPLEYIKNGFKVGPNPCVPPGPTAPHWIDQDDVRVHQDCADLDRWWTVFKDPVLDGLIARAASQNLSLREAGFRIMEARAQLKIASGDLFAQSQSAFGSYQRGAASENSNTSPGLGTQFFDQRDFGFNLSWEIDFWGRFRRAVASAEDTLQASCANYDHVLVTLLGDMASNYVQIRTLQQRIAYVRSNVDLQSRIFAIAERRVKAGAKGALDLHQAQSNLAQTEAQIPQLRLAMRHASDRLCVLLGMPPTDLESELGSGAIPTAPPTVAVGIPAELLRRRPDVRRAEHLTAAQGQRIGIAEADLYPAFAINGTLGWESENLKDLFNSKSLNSVIGPVFQWNILNYGRIRNNVRMQDARFRALVAAYQDTVLRANAEVEDGLSAFLRAQERTALLDRSVASAQQAVDIVTREYEGGAADFNRVALIEQNLVQQQDLQAQSHGEIAQGLIQVYRALGGGWEAGPPDSVELASTTAAPAEVLPVPADHPVPPPPPQLPRAPMRPPSAAPAAGTSPPAQLPAALMPPHEALTSHQPAGTQLPPDPMSPHEDPMSYQPLATQLPTPPMPPM
jgi:NodT family efflux transporter outer membrane factor (OMF) lipoprotein